MKHNDFLRVTKGSDYTKVIPLCDLEKTNSFDWDLLNKEVASVNLDSLLKDKSP